MADFQTQKYEALQLGQNVVSEFQVEYAE